MSELKKITNLIPSDLVIEDLGIRLRGIGDSCIASTHMISLSKDIINNSKFVKVEQFKIDNKMPIWPFMKESKNVKEVPSYYEQSDDMKIIKKQIHNIESGLQILLSRSQLSIGSVEKYKLTHSVISDKQEILSDPIFIQSNIVPRNVDSSIKVKKDAIKVNDFNKNLDILRKVRKEK